MLKNNFHFENSFNDFDYTPTYHLTQGDVWIHTLHTVDAAAELCNRDGLTGSDRLAIMFGALCHDMGKVNTTEVQADGKITSYQHDKLGVDPAESFMNSIGAPLELVEEVKTLVAEHMIHFHAGKDLNLRVVRRLANRIHPHTTIKKVSLVMEADHWGRPPLPRKHPCPELLVLAQQLNVESTKPVAFLCGKNLIPLGFKPGPSMGVTIRRAFELQLDGILNSEEEAIQWAQQQRQ